MKNLEPVYKSAYKKYSNILPSVHGWSVQTVKDRVITDAEQDERALQLMIDCDARYVISISFLGGFLLAPNGIDYDIYFDVVFLGFKSAQGRLNAESHFMNTFGVNEFKLYENE